MNAGCGCVARSSRPDVGTDDTPPMNTSTPLTKTEAELAAAFTAVFKNVKPKPARVTRELRLAPYRKQVLKLRSRGLDWQTIAAGMADPRIGEKVSGRLLKRLFGPRRKASTGPTKLPADRLLLDPLTNRPITPPAN